MTSNILSFCDTVKEMAKGKPNEVINIGNRVMKQHDQICDESSLLTRLFHFYSPNSNDIVPFRKAVTDGDNQ